MDNEMTQDATQQPAPLAPRRHSMALTYTLAAVTLIAVGAAGSWYASTAGAESKKPDTCAQAQRVIDDYMKQYGDASSASVSDEQRAQALEDTRTVLNVQVQNPSCFSPEERASAQTQLDALDQAADQELQQQASSPPDCIWNNAGC
ncbi:hypothetical protein [Streptomyces sp. NBC_00576]|uniref:hypothetical protein n=1 Tax=Streptomyces sp. NBC_00576 TaxID=2903665 RepID=UPI002E7FD247|nr:hypothetical protein [Streptomyces sp. NBC_00576]WUB77690.1 hypothetical protein OG734_47835 [Streptomyces sp. NBC_00576]